MPLRAGSVPTVPAAVAGHGRSPRQASAPYRKSSMVRSSATSFGIVGKTVITVVVLAVGALVAFGNLLGVPVYLVFLAWVLRDLWTRERRAVVPSRPAAQARTVAGPVQGWVRGQAPSAYDGTVRPPAP